MAVGSPPGDPGAGSTRGCRADRVGVVEHRGTVGYVGAAPLMS